MMLVLAYKVMEVGGAASPVADNEYRGFFESELFDFISEIEILKYLKGGRDDDHNESKRQPKNFAGIYLTHRKYSEKIGNSAANKCGNGGDLKIFVFFAQS